MVGKFSMAQRQKDTGLGGGGRGVPVLEKIFARLSLPSEAPFLLSPALILSSGRFCKRKEHKELALPGMVFVTDMTV